ncbi:MAG: PLP-dependent transferase [Armatimonadetes bacterium]|nr:PLP-dependent transferase [Armatimonadota bacterium]
MKRETLLQHLGEERHHLGAVTPPIFQTSLFVQPDFDTFRGKLKDPSQSEERFVYSRVGNPNLSIVEKKLAMLEGTESALVFASGMAAISAAILHCVRAGDHIVCIDTAYGPTREFLTNYLPDFGIETTFVAGCDSQEIFDACTEDTKLVYLESPSSILFRAQDFRAVSAFARERGIWTVADNSNATPLFQQPHSLGIDIVVHSATKYLCGHSDVVAGALCARKDVTTAIELREGQWFGGRLAPFDAWLMLRGLRTLKLRVDEAQRQGRLLFDFVKGLGLGEVLYSGDPDHPQAGLISQQQTGHTSLVTLIPTCQEESAVKQFLESLKVFQMGVSWGGFESLAVPVFGKPMDWPDERWMVRFYAGLEDIADLQLDISAAAHHLAPAVTAN